MPSSGSGSASGILAGPAYTAWPTVADMDTRLADAGITLRASVTSDRKQELLAAVVAEVGHRTGRQFLPDASDTTRVYDGSGTAELEVDEMVSLTSVAVIGLQSDPGYSLSDVTLVDEPGQPRNRLVTGRGSLPALARSGAAWPVRHSFPAGRQNIRVTGKFGYAAAIPADLWSAVADEAAARLAAEALFRPSGQVQEWREADVMKRFRLVDAGDGTRWTPRFREALCRYRRPALGRRLRRVRSPMI